MEFHEADPQDRWPGIIDCDDGREIRPLAHMNAAKKQIKSNAKRSSKLESGNPIKHSATPPLRMVSSLWDECGDALIGKGPEIDA